MIRLAHGKAACPQLGAQWGKPGWNVRVEARNGQVARLAGFLPQGGIRPSAGTWSGSISLVDPATATALPMEAISGKIVSEHGEVTALVTILHDRTGFLFEDNSLDALANALRRASCAASRARMASQCVPCQ